MLKSPANFLFYLLMIFTVGLMVPMAYSVYGNIVIYKQKLPQGYRWPAVEDFWITVVASFIFATIELVCKKYLYVLFIPICKVQKNEVEREVRCKKAVFCLYKTFYFTFATGWAYVIMKDEPYLSWTLGGKGDYANAFVEFPYVNNTPGLKMYSLVTMGYHVGGLVTHFMQARKNDFAEMALHHIVSLFLFTGYYLANVWKLGCPVAFLHDIADIGISLSKCIGETRYSNLAATVFISTMCVWFWTRMVVLPFDVIYKLGLYFPEEPYPIAKPAFMWLLGMMTILHYYWMSLFFKMVTHYKKTGDGEDLQNKSQVT